MLGPSRPFLLLLALGVVVSACSSATDDASDDTSATAQDAGEAPDEETAEAASAEAEPTADPAAGRVVEHAGGSTEVPAAPERVATSSEVVAGHLVSAGLLPIAGPDGVADWLEPYDAAGLLGDLDTSQIAEIYGEEPDFELLATLEPDLILIEEWELEQYDLYAAIAPTVVISRPTNADWKAAFDQSVAAAGIEEGAAAVRARYDALVAEVGPDASGTVVTFLRGAGPGQFRIDALGGFGGSVAEEAGYRVDVGGVSEEEAREGQLMFSNERLEVVTGDLLVTTTQEEGGPSNIDELKASPLWENIPAVANARIIELPQGVYNGGTYVAAELLLEALLAAPGSG
jgi:iron complex transport system substrate-binding protein